MRKRVAPLAGAWIEIQSLMELPATSITVAPLAGAWIEICCCAVDIDLRAGRPPRGGVD